MRLELICTQKVIKQRHVSGGSTVNCEQFTIQRVFIVDALTLCENKQTYLVHYFMQVRLLNVVYRS